MEDLLAHVCADLAGSSTVCEKQAKEMLPLVIKMLTTFTPQEVCEILRACDSGRMYRSMLLSYDARAAEANFFTCKVCETVMKIVNGLLSSHRTQATVAAALKKACGLVPLGMGGLCRRIVGPFSKELIHLFLENASPRTICSAIHMCRVFEESFVEKTCETCSSPFSWVHDDGV
ncbi:prosaposin-like isoform X2 [Stegastes partitus]|uniref:Prosaposin-like isoform X2 n=1 Tax=Stegastes partitus TaxID=144197 RepID=A0A9Y4NGS5_9TELE|nr:PREDICTED: prosaposin-like isoform X2 [Stegastes partitus]